MAASGFTLSDSSRHERKNSLRKTEGQTDCETILRETEPKLFFNYIKREINKCANRN